MIEGDLSPVRSVSYVLRQQLFPPQYRTCNVKSPRAWHVVGAVPCNASHVCCTHYGLCLPVSTYLLDAQTLLGVLDLDVETIKRILPTKKSLSNQLSPRNSLSFPDPPSAPQTPTTLRSSPSDPSSSTSRPASTVADLAAPKRAGRLPGGPDGSSSAGTPQRRGSHRGSPTSNLFSFELMQTDDVSTIAAQIANQADLIYQAWKTNDLNPSELIHYHSISSNRSSPLSSSGSFHSGPTSPSASSPRIPVRNISPAPPGSSPAIPRRVIDIPISTDKSSNVYPKQTYSQQGQPLGQQQTTLYQKSQSSPQQYQPSQFQQQKTSQFQPAQSSYQQQPTLQLSQLQPPSSPQSHQYSHQQHAASPSPARSLNASPRPYIPPSSSDISSQSSSTQFPRVLNSSTIAPPSPGALGGGGGGGGGTRPLSFRGTPSQPPPPPERSSSYVDPQPQQIQTQPPGHTQPQPSKQRDVLADPDLEASLRELVTKFVMEDKARLANTKIVTDHLKSNSPSSIQDALNRFERQMAITSRVSSNATPNHHTTTPAISSSFTPSPVTSSLPQTAPAQHAPKSYSSVRNEPSNSLSDSWNRREMESRSRRSISPNPAVSHPGWNEPPPSNTSTWPLKNKQPAASPERRNTSTTSSATSQAHTNPGSVTTLTGGSPHSTNYITTLEAHVDSQGRSPGVPIRHKVVTMTGTNREEDRLVQVLRKTPMIEDKDSLRPVETAKSLSSSPPTLTSAVTPSSPPSPSVIVPSRGGATSSSCPTTSTSKSKKYSISVTVDVEGKAASPEPPGLSPVANHDTPDSVISQAPGQQQMWQSTQEHAENLSTVDYAKIRFQDAQQRPKTSQRLEDFKSYSSKTAMNGDGRVMQVKSRFETSGGEPAHIPEVPWRVTGSEDVGSTLSEMYRRKMRKIRKVGSPEPAHALASLPHPQLTDQQKAHIRERSQSPTMAIGGTSTAVRPFLTQGSVAERVLLFEKAPAELKKSAASSSLAAISDRRRPAFSTWKDPDEVRTKAQDVIPAPPSPPRPLEILPSSPGSTPTASKASQLREPLTTSLANKENARPMPLNAAMGGAAPHITPSPSAPGISQGAIISPASLSPPASMGVVGGTGLAAQIPTRVPGRRMDKTSKNILIPRFYYPMGRPLPQCSQEQSTEVVMQCFREHGGQIERDNMEPLMRACRLPLYWKAPLFVSAGGDKLGHITQEQFMDYWTRLIATCHDTPSRFVRILNRGLRNHLLPEDYFSLIQDVVDTHPGLTFLKEATEFHSRYVQTVIARIYYCVNRSWSGRITIPELRRSNLLQVISYLEEEEDINKITDYFSYEHFYVIYCKFWELDTDHDLFIDRNDLAKHNERALSDKIIDRIFSGAVTKGRVQKQDRMGYQEFVWFLISEEDKRHPTAIEYWFRCMDLDGDGYLSMYELEYFYEDQLQRMEALGIETLPFTDCICQMLDMVRPDQADLISLSDLKKCRMTPVFFDTFFNFDKYLDHEQRDPFASHRMDDEGPEISDWDRYAAVEYELLVAEEGGGDSQDDMLYGDEDELSMGVDNVLDGSECDLGVIGSELGIMGMGGSLKKHANLSATVPNLALDQMDVDEEYSDYADSDDY